MDIVGELNFGLAAQGLSNGGAIHIDPRTGARTVTGGLVSVSGMSVHGNVRITGQPLSRIRIGLPSNVKMNAPRGGKAEIIDLAASIPLVTTLNASGVLEFTFAGRFVITAPDDGDFNGRVQITADYE